MTVTDELDASFPEANYLLAFLHVRGLGVARDIDKAETLCRVAASAGLPAGQYLLGRIILDKNHLSGDPISDQEKAEVINWYSKAAEQGHALAACDLAAIYREGVFDTVNLVLAIKWSTLAASQESASSGDASFFLGTMYENGEGAIVDGQEALRWYRRAANLGSVSATMMLGDVYRQGRLGVTADEAEACRFYAEGLSLRQAQEDKRNAEIRAGALSGDYLSKEMLKVLRTAESR